MKNKIGSEQLKERTLAKEFNRIEITKKDGTKQKLNSAETKSYIAGLLFGGKTLNQLEQCLIKAGVKGTSWADRKKIISLLEDRFKNKIDKDGMKELRQEFEIDESEE